MQYLHAVGAGLAIKWTKPKEIVYVSSGEGTTSQGDFHEALNWASREKLPVIFHIEDNEYAISVHKSQQMAGGSVYKMIGGYQNLARYNVDGTDFFETDLAFKKAAERGRKGRGPSVIISHVVRLAPHSSSDDHRKYRTEKELEDMEKRDPINRFELKCIQEKMIKQKEFDQIKLEIIQSVSDDADWAEKQDNPDADTALDHLYSNVPELEETELNPISDKIVIIDAISHALAEEMERNEKIIIYGEDVADPKGGVFTGTRGLTDKFGDTRVFNAPLAESSIAGTALGLATSGFKPIVEIQFGDYIWTAMMHIKDEISMVRYRSNGEFKCPIVIRVPVGGYIHGGPYHSQSIDSYFFHMPGIRVAYPSNAADAKGLLKAACRMDDPVLFFEHKGLYRQGYAASPEPDENYILPFGKANLIQEGDELTIVTWGAMVQKCIEAIKISEMDKGQIDLIDIRTLNPIDWDSIYSSVIKTGKLLIVHEDTLTGGVGAEISAKVSQDLFEDLDGPIQRVAAKDCHIPYSAILEGEILPQTDQIIEALNNLMEY
jgi:2-oxoisovalerate dehydrogenase E1 component